MDTEASNASVSRQALNHARDRILGFSCRRVQLRPAGSADEEGGADPGQEGKDRASEVPLALLVSHLGGCASYSAKVTGTPPAGARQLLLTGAAGRALGCLNFRPLAGEAAYLDASRVAAPDSAWLVFDLRRAMARQGVLLVDDRKEARVVVAAAVGAYGTDEVDRRISTPDFTPFGLFSLLVATDARTHRLVWESGTVLRSESLEREFVGSHEIGRRATLPDLEG